MDDEIDDMIAEQIFDDVDDAQEQVERRFLEKRNPFELSNVQFVKMFRLTKQLVRYLIELLTPLLIQPSRRSALTVETKVSIVIDSKSQVLTYS